MDIVHGETGIRVCLGDARAKVTLGRSPECNVVLADLSVSRHHASLDNRLGQWRITDTGSRNGVYVNGLRVQGSVPVAPGDRLQLGDTVLTLEATSDQDLATNRPAQSGVAQFNLSPREVEVLHLLAAGRTDKQIADELYLSVKTVHSHLDRVRDKVGLRRRSELTGFAIKHGIA